jgi:glycosyltransferase involved in cell wall biosynthesis
MAMVKLEDVSIIVPVYNEERALGDLLGEIRLRYPQSEVIVVNDGSEDATAAVAREAGAIVYSHPYNIGNGAAVKSGIRIASGRYLVFLDGDGQHDPAEIETLLAELPAYDMVVGARASKAQSSRGRAVANWIYNALASYVTRFPIRDLTSGFRALRADIAHQFLYLLPNTYSYPTTLTLCVLRNGRSLRYVPVRTRGRQSGNSKIRLFHDGARFLLIITKICTLYSPLRVFLPVSGMTFVLGLSYYLYTFFRYGRFTNMSALLFTTAVLIFLMGLVSEQICQMRFERSEGDRFI